MAGKNLHLEHLEDEIINYGIAGGRASINFLRELRDMMKGNASGRVNMTVKWDGAPAIWCGPHPETGKFFIAKKSLFNKGGGLFYSSIKEINDTSDLNGTLKTKFTEAFNAFSGVGMKEILQGDLMFTSGDKSNTKMDGVDYITFQPNTIVYAVQKDSKLGKEIDKATLGVVWHTTYKGSTIDGLSASFGAKLPPAPSKVWQDDATYKDQTGYGNMTAKETLKLTQALTATGKSFHGITAKDLKKFNDVQGVLTSKGASGASYKTYTNTLIRKGKWNPNGRDYLTHVENYWKDKIVAKVKMQKTKDIKIQIGKDIMRDLNTIKKMVDNLAQFQGHLITSKSLIVTALNRIKSIGTFVKTDTGFKVVNPEGYVAIDSDGSAVKLVDRMEFSQNNFNAAKAWDK
tara:strand:+ start:28458 stop:29663 length:1206 start_codon:yes stop_codon:yes gene_type:complete